MKIGGKYIYDFRNGNAVINNLSKERKKEAKLEEIKVLRTSNTTLDLVTQRALVNFHFDISRRGRKIETFTEEHLIRYFFIQEMHDLLLLNGFSILQKCPFLEPEVELLGTEWNVSFVVKALTQSKAVEK